MMIQRLDDSSGLVFKLAIAVSLVMLAVFARLAPHPANFAPLAAIALFGGVILPKKWALSVPFIAMATSDLVIGLHPLIAYTWGSFALITLIGSKFGHTLSINRVVISSIASSILFFVITNFGVWMERLMYAPTIHGLVQCYTNALPFFRNTLLGDLLYCGMLFGAYAIVARFAYRYRTFQRSATA
jgi:hypothetical protein